MFLSKRILIAILILAAALRFTGITHGLPHIYNVDEPALVRSVMGLRFDWNPHHFDWPHFHFYFCYLFFQGLVKFRTLLQVIGLRQVVESAFPLLWQDPQIFYLEMRLISALMGVLTIIPIYLTGRKLFSRQIGLVSAAVYAVGPFIVENAHYAVLDTPLTFWIAWAMYFSTLAFLYQRWRDYLLAGLFVGLATSTKYNGVMAGLSVFGAGVFGCFFSVPCNISHPDESQDLPGADSGSGSGMTISDIKQKANFLECAGIGLTKLLTAGIVSIFAFTAGTPFVLLAADEAFAPKGSPGYNRGLLWQLNRGGSHFDAGAPIRVLESLGDLSKIVGLVPLVFAVLSLFVFLQRDKSKKVKTAFIFFFPLIYFLYIGSGEFKMLHYFLPLAPYLALLAGIGINNLIGIVMSHSEFNSESKRGYLRIALVIIMLFPSLFLSSRRSYILAQTDTRQLASDWVAENTAENSVVAQDGEYQPVLDNVETVPLTTWTVEWFDEKSIDYALLAGYGIDSQRLNSQAGEDLINRLEIIKQIRPQSRPGPTIFIYQYK